MRERAEAAEEERPGALRPSGASAPARRRSSRGARRGGPATTDLDLGLALLGAWLRDLAAAGDGAADLVLNADRRAELEATAGAVDPRRAPRAAGW